MPAHKSFCLALDRQADRIHVSKQLWVNTAPSGWHPHILFHEGETEARRGLRQGWSYAGDRPPLDPQVEQ